MLIISETARRLHDAVFRHLVHHTKCYLLDCVVADDAVDLNCLELLRPRVLGSPSLSPAQNKAFRPG